MTAPALARRFARRRVASGVSGRILWLIVIAGFFVFFALPIIWLLLAPTKTDA